MQLTHAHRQLLDQWRSSITLSQLPEPLKWRCVGCLNEAVVTHQRWLTRAHYCQACSDRLIRSGAEVIKAEPPKKRSSSKQQPKAKTAPAAKTEPKTKAEAKTKVRAKERQAQTKIKSPDSANPTIVHHITEILKSRDLTVTQIADAVGKQAYQALDYMRAQQLVIQQGHCPVRYRLAGGGR